MHSLIGNSVKAVIYYDELYQETPPSFPVSSLHYPSVRTLVIITVVVLQDMTAARGEVLLRLTTSYVFFGDRLLSRFCCPTLILYYHRNLCGNTRCCYMVFTSSEGLGLMGAKTHAGNHLLDVSPHLTSKPLLNE
jgi:hypothetical protein